MAKSKAPIVMNDALPKVSEALPNGSGKRRVRFIVPGEPVAKARPRLAGRRRVYTPQKTAAYEGNVRDSYNFTGAGLLFPKGVPLRLEAWAYFQAPKNTSKKRLARMEAGKADALPMKKPDGDNILKALGDALNGFAYHDDAQVVVWTIHKRYSKTPRAEILLEEVMDEEEA